MDSRFVSSVCEHSKYRITVPYVFASTDHLHHGLALFFVYSFFLSFVRSFARSLVRSSLASAVHRFDVLDASLCGGVYVGNVFVELQVHGDFRRRSALSHDFWLGPLNRIAFGL